MRLNVVPKIPPEEVNDLKLKIKEERKNMMDNGAKEKQVDKEPQWLRELIWLPESQLPKPRLDNIPVYYIERFDSLTTILNQIASGHTPRPQISMRYELLRLCTLRTYPKEDKPYLIKLAGAGYVQLTHIYLATLYLKYAPFHKMSSSAQCGRFSLIF